MKKNLYHSHESHFTISLIYLMNRLPIALPVSPHTTAVNYVLIALMTIIMQSVKLVVQKSMQLALNPRVYQVLCVRNVRLNIV